MKVLTTEAQLELQQLLEGLKDQDLDTQGQINYWAIELKPKRVRRKEKVLDNSAEVV